MMTNGELLNILVVDDEAQITRVLGTALSGRGYTVRTASDGDHSQYAAQLDMERRGYRTA
jgi:CheY-like chemotaxis protein